MGRSKSATIRRRQQQLELVERWGIACTKRAAEIGGWRCEKCGKGLNKSTAIGHHRWPVALGGPYIAENCQLRCAKCEDADYHWIAKNGIKVVQHLLNGSTARLKKEAIHKDKAAFDDLNQPLEFFQLVVEDAMKRQRGKFRKEGPLLRISPYQWYRCERYLNLYS